MPIAINLRTIKIRTINQFVSESLNYNDDILFQGKGQVVQIVGNNNQDNTQNLIYIVKPELVEIKKSNLELPIPKTITNDLKIKEKSPSQMLRQKAYRIAQEIGGNEEELYLGAIEAGSEYLDQLKESILLEVNPA